MATFTHNRSVKTNIGKLLKFFMLLLGVIFIFTGLFLVIMIQVENRTEYNFLDGLYWTLVTMSTLGYGDITFYTNLGRFYSLFVLLTGVVFLLVLLPFTFIQFFYAPWLEAYNNLKTPKELPEDTEGHVIITKFEPVTKALIEKLRQYNHKSYILIRDQSEALELYESGYKVIVGDLDDPETWRKIRADKASMIVATDNDMVNTNAAFTARQLTQDVPVVTMASHEDSVDILKLAGSTFVLRLAHMLGQSLGRRTLGGSARVHVIGRFDKLVIGEAPAVGTPLVGKTLAESKLREQIGVNVVGIWERGKFNTPTPDMVINERTVLVLAGSVEQLRNYDEFFGIFHSDDNPVIIIGAGRVGMSTAQSLADRKMDYRIIEKDPTRITDPEKFILGDAADLNTLKKAGIDNAHTVIITSNRDDINIYLTLYCRRLRPDVQITARATEDRNISSLHRAGADFVMSYASMGANAIFNLLERSEVLMLAEGLNVFRVQAPDLMIGKNLIDSAIRQKTGCNIIGVKRGDEMHINPDPKTEVTEDDELVVIGDYESEEKFLKLTKAD